MRLAQRDCRRPDTRCRRPELPKRPEAAARPVYLYIRRVSRAAASRGSTRRQRRTTSPSLEGIPGASKKSWEIVSRHDIGRRLTVARDGFGVRRKSPSTAAYKTVIAIVGACAVDSASARARSASGKASSIRPSTHNATASIISAAARGSGFQLSLYGLFGILLAAREGLEVNLLGLSLGSTRSGRH